MEARQLSSTARLWLSFAGRHYPIALADGESITIGRGEECDCVFDREFVSRRHARIEARRQSYILVDESSNGTFVRLEDQTVVYLHRRSKRLWGEGYISFGEPLTTASAVHFRLDQ
jgi:predicted component of type VI protein secretion system